MKPGQEKIWKALEDNEAGLRFTDLKKTTSLSAPALSAYLKEFREDGLISLNEDSKAYFIPELAKYRENPPSWEIPEWDPRIEDAPILNTKESNELIKEFIRRNLIVKGAIQSSNERAKNILDKRKLRDWQNRLINATLETSVIGCDFLRDMTMMYIVMKISELSETNYDEVRIKREVYKGLVKGFKDVVLPYYDSVISYLAADGKLVSENIEAIGNYILSEHKE